MATWLLFSLLGVGTGSLYAALAVAMIITYRGSGVVNFAVGAMAMIPAVVYAELRTTGDLILPVVLIPSRYELGAPMAFIPAALTALFVGGLVALLSDALIFRRLRTAPPVTALVATVGLTVVLQSLAVKSFGDRTVRTPPILPDHVVSLFGKPFPIDRVWVTIVMAILAGAVAAVYRYTRFGLATRAAFLDEKGAVLLGLDPRRLGQANWIISALVAGAMGILASSLGGVSPFNYSLYVVPAFAAVLAARLQSIPVAVGGATLIGMFEALAVHLVAQRHVPDFLLGGVSSLVPFVVIIGALMIRGRSLPGRSAILDPARVPVPPVPHPALWVVSVAGAALILGWGNAPLRFAMMQTLVVTTLLLSFVVITGFIGQVSLAQLAFAGFAAFMLPRFDGLPFPLGPVLAVGLATVVGAMVSIPALRVRGILFAIVSYSAAVVLDEVLYRSPTFVGTGGLASVESPRLGPLDLGIFAGGFPSRTFGFVALVCTLACAAVVAGVRRSGLGRRMLAVRTNERAAAASGVDVVATKVAAAGLASAIAATGGVMFAYKAVDFNGAGLTAQDGLDLLALAYVGGIGSIAGASIGGLLAPSGLLPQVLTGGGSSIDQALLTGVALIMVTVALPGGLAGSWSTFRDRERTGPSPPPPETPTGEIVVEELA